MTSRERVLYVLRGERADRVPAAGLLTSVTGELMELSGAFWPRAHWEAEDMARLAAAAGVYCGLDTLKLPFDMCVEAEALGCTVDFGDRMRLPQVRGTCFAWGELPRGFARAGRVDAVLRAIGTARREFPDLAAVSSVVGPFTLCQRLYGMEDWLVGAAEEPEFAREAMEAVTDIVTGYAAAQARAGSDLILIGEAGCSGDLISPDMYRDLALPAHKRLCAALPIPCALHICGNCTGHLPHIALAGARVFSFDHHTDPAAARRSLAGRALMAGWVDAAGVFRSGGADEVRATAADCVANGADILCAGCAWPPDVPLANARALSLPKFPLTGGREGGMLGVVSDN